MKIVVTHSKTNTLIDSDHIPINLQNLSEVEDASCTFVNLADCMDYVPINEREKLLGYAIAKVRTNGILCISGTDLSSVCKAYWDGVIEKEQVNASLYSGRLSSVSLADVLSLLKKLNGFKLTNAKITGYYYSVILERTNA